MSISTWTEDTDNQNYPKLGKNLSVDVCVVGGGLGGIATALLLQRDGKSVCVLESATLGSGQTGQTTAHVTTALDDRYDQLEHFHGTLGIRLAAESHQSALNLIEQLATSLNIQCELERVKGYLFLDPKDSMSILSRELKAVHRAGLNDVHAVDEIPSMPFDTGPALCFPNQIQFHPLQFLSGLAKEFIAAGGMIYTHTPVVEIKGGSLAKVTTHDNRNVFCKAVVVATNSPVNDIFAIHTKQAPYRSYVISANIPKGSIPKGLYWDTPDPYHYVRTQAGRKEDSYDSLLVGGEDHKTGQNTHPEDAYRKLEIWMRQRFPMAREISHRWSGQIMEPMDGLAYLGHNPMDRDNVYVITGDSGNGMTHAMIGAIIITDQIMGRPNPWETLYQPSRKNLRAIKDFIRENANVAVQYGDWFGPGDVNDTDEIERGQGGVVRQGTHLIAAYRDEKGNLHTNSATCPHLGGIVRWNSAEKTWDCPCHGSRFDVEGKVIEGPACKNLKPAQKNHADLMPIIVQNAIPDINSSL
jgi:glycine/D-amino acid oxidase-like deaminating enzyme/nitrite reductase/ring-hydroxylating ferredoxin subunit